MLTGEVLCHVVPATTVEGYTPSLLLHVQPRLPSCGVAMCQAVLGLQYDSQQRLIPGQPEFLLVSCRLCCKAQLQSCSGS